MMIKRKYIVGLLLALSGFSCTKEPAEVDAPFLQRTVLIYMAADNNLYNNAKKDIQEILKNTIPENNNLLVYLDAPSWSADSCPQLFQVKEGERISVKKYPPHNSASAEVLREITADVINLFRASSYGLILWLHGTGWLPEKIFGSLKSSANILHTVPLLKSFGKDGENEMSIIDLAQALPVTFEYIIFDACLMSSIEVLYQLRNKAKIIIASPTETLVDGFPYDKIIPFLFDATPLYAEIAQIYMEHYKNKSGILQSATIAVVDTKQLTSFASMLKETVAGGNVTALTDKSQIQQYDMLQSSIFYDLQDCLEHLITEEQQLTLVREQLSKAVIYNDFTPYFILEYPIKKSCGISVYISSVNNDLDRYYKTLDWYIDIGLGL
jgi:hypothetical protein